MNKFLILFTFNLLTGKIEEGTLLIQQDCDQDSTRQAEKASGMSLTRSP